jgi:hypothetical protein
VSLINDALRKARQAAAEHEQNRDRSLPPPTYPRRRRRASGTGVLLLVAIAAGVLGAAVVWWSMTRSAPGKVPVARAEANAAGDAATLEETAAIVEPTPTASAGTAEAGPGSRPTAHGTTTGDAGPDPAARRPEGPSSPSSAQPLRPPAEAAGTDEATAPESAPASGSGERVFVLDADLGGVTLSLGYIVFRPVRPFAEINGVEVYEGSEIAGFTVEKIEADMVTLSDTDGPLVLRVP